MAPLFKRQISTDLSPNDVFSIDGTVTADVDKAVVDDAREVVTRRWGG
jgi:hypothetical protein